MSGIKAAQQGVMLWEMRTALQEQWREVSTEPPPEVHTVFDKHIPLLLAVPGMEFPVRGFFTNGFFFKYETAVDVTIGVRLFPTHWMVMPPLPTVAVS